jgi:RNA polymerase sigma-70 factor, ECF subfamily
VYAVTTRLPGRAAAVERPSFTDVAEQHLDDVHAYLVYLTGDRNVAEDLTAESFEKAFRSWKRYDPRRASARTWLCQIARSTALDHFRSEERRRRREGTYALRELTSEEPVFGEGFSPALDSALRELSAAEREVIALCVVLDLDGETAARLLGITTTACSTRLSRALQKLQRKVELDVLA